ncbi:MAG: hypothetical protein ACE144_21695 [Thermodesulfobacteriota bacterium]
MDHPEWASFRLRRVPRVLPVGEGAKGFGEMEPVTLGRMSRRSRIVAKADYIWWYHRLWPWGSIFFDEVACKTKDS